MFKLHVRSHHTILVFVCFGVANLWQWCFSVLFLRFLLTNQIDNQTSVDQFNLLGCRLAFFPSIFDRRCLDIIVVQGKSGSVCVAVRQYFAGFVLNCFATGGSEASGMIFFVCEVWDGDYVIVLTGVLFQQLQCYLFWYLCPICTSLYFWWGEIVF